METRENKEKNRGDCWRQLKYERKYWSKGINYIAGIDEAGRGPLAGPVVAASVNWGNAPLIEGIKDSKKISEKKRFILFDLIVNNNGYIEEEVIMSIV